MRKIVIAAQAFKGTLSAFQACQAIEEGILSVYSSAVIKKIPVADGGDGSMEVLVRANRGEIRHCLVSDALGVKRPVLFGYFPQNASAVVAFSDVCGLASLEPEQQDPFQTSSFGVGEVILSILKLSCKRCILCLGGTATNDAGSGLAAALGLRFLDEQGNSLPLGGGHLGKLALIDFSGMNPALASCELIAACDVVNPIVGPQGASLIYSPQKGASPQMAIELDKALQHFVSIILKQTGSDISFLRYGGSAGGAGAGIAALLGGKLESGSELILNSIGFDEALEGCDLVITGEGRIDRQTTFGKAPMAVTKRAKKRGIPVIMFAGSLGVGHEEILSYGVEKVFSLPEGQVSPFEALKEITATVFRNET
jgi:glycerate kinase